MKKINLFIFLLIIVASCSKIENVDLINYEPVEIQGLSDEDKASLLDDPTLLEIFAERLYTEYNLNEDKVFSRSDCFGCT